MHILDCLNQYISNMYSSIFWINYYIPSIYSNILNVFWVHLVHPQCILNTCTCKHGFRCALQFGRKFCTFLSNQNILLESIIFFQKILIQKRPKIRIFFKKKFPDHIFIFEKKIISLTFWCLFFKLLSSKPTIHIQYSKPLIVIWHNFDLSYLLKFSST